MKRWNVLFDDFGTVRQTMVLAPNAAAAAEEFADLYGFDVVSVEVAR